MPTASLGDGRPGRMNLSSAM